MCKVVLCHAYCTERKNDSALPKVIQNSLENYPPMPVEFPFTILKLFFKVNKSSLVVMQELQEHSEGVTCDGRVAAEFYMDSMTTQLEFCLDQLLHYLITHSKLPLNSSSFQRSMQNSCMIMLPELLKCFSMVAGEANSCVRHLDWRSRVAAA